MLKLSILVLVATAALAAAASIEPLAGKKLTPLTEAGVPDGDKEVAKRELLLNSPYYGYQYNSLYRNYPYYTYPSDFSYPSYPYQRYYNYYY